MTNPLITLEEASREMTASLNEVIEKLRAEGISDTMIAQGIEDVFARFGGFPAREES